MLAHKDTTAVSGRVQQGPEEHLVEEYLVLADDIVAGAKSVVGNPAAVEAAEVAGNYVVFNQIISRTLVHGDAAAPINASIAVDFVVSNDYIVVLGVEALGADADAAGYVSLVVGHVVVADDQVACTGDREDSAACLAAEDGEAVN